MQFIKQSTVTTIYVGPVLDSSGAAVTTAVTADFRLIKNGTPATLTGGTATHDVNGYYTIALTTGNCDTLGRLTIASGNTSHSMAAHKYSVLPASVFDAIITNATNSTGGLPTATGAISGLAGSISTYAGGAVASVTGNVGGNVVGSVGSVTGSVGSVAGSVTGSVASVTGNVGGNVVGNINGSVATVTNPVTVGTNNDKNGYGLAADQAVNVTKVGGVTVSGPNDLKANVSGLSTFNPATDLVALQPAQQVYAVKLGTAWVINDDPDSVLVYGIIGSSILTSSSLTTALNSYGAAKTSDVSGVPAAVWANTTRTLSAFGFSVTVGTNNDKLGYGLAADQAVNVTKVGGTSVSGPNDLKANVSGIQAVTDKLDTMLVVDGLVYQWTANSLEFAPTGSGGGGDSAATIYTYFTDGTRANAFKADVSALATTSQLNARTLLAAEYADATNAADYYASLEYNQLMILSGVTNIRLNGIPNIQSRLPAALIGGKMDSTATAVLDPDDIQDISDAVSASVGAEIVTEVERTGGMLQTLSAKFTGITFIRDWIAFIMGKTPDPATLAEVNATTAANNYTNVTDSQEAIRDRGDEAWSGGGSSGGGSGGTNYQITITSNGNAEEGVAVWVSTDAEGTNVVAGTIYTNALGIVEFALDDLDYYIWVRKSRINFSNPTFMSSSPIAINGTAATVNPDIESGVCELSLTLYSQGTTQIVPLVGVSVTAKMPSDYAVRNSIIHFNVIDVAATDSEGFALLKLVQNTVYDIYVTAGNSIKARKIRITTPATQTANLSELI